MSHAAFVYLDDGISGHKQRLDAVAASIIHKNDLTLSGLVANDEKCHWGTNAAVGPSVRLFTRQLFYTISQRGFWSDYLTDIPPLLVEELRFWLTNLGCLNGYSMTPKVSAEPLYIYTDASSFGYGGYLASLHEFKAQGHWTLQQKVKSSTFRELLAILQVLKVFLKHLEHKRIKVFSDSQSACCIVLVGSRVPELQHIAVEIFNLCFFNDIQIESQWIPRTQNQIADALSKATDLDDYSTYYMPNGVLSPSIDAEAVDCFTQNWSNDTNWLCPPVSLVIPTIRHMCSCKGTGTLIVPYWPSAIFWPMIMPGPGRYASFIKETLVLPKCPHMCIPGKGQLIAYQSKPSVFMDKFRVAQPIWL
ncbi:Integrase recombinase xerD-like, partial [Paramuricea clavata]